MTKFEVGDQVEAFGDIGFVECVSSEKFIDVRFNDKIISFYKNGMYLHWATESSLKLIKKAKKKVKKKVKGYMSDKMIGVSDGYLLWLSKDKIQYNIPCIEIEFEIEVEE